MQKGKKTAQTERLLLTFDLNDEKQKSVYEVLRNAGYGKRTPIVVEAMAAQTRNIAWDATDDVLESVARKAAEMATSMAFDNFRKMLNTEASEGNLKMSLPEASPSVSSDDGDDLDYSIGEDTIPESILKDAVRLSALFD